MDPVENTSKRVATLEEQLKFALVCVKYAENGKVNWENVGKEFEISKGAAAKRYERLLKAHNMTPASTKVAGTKRAAAETDGSENDDNAVTISPSDAASKKKAARATGAATKKRKTSGKTSEVGDVIATAARTAASKKTAKVGKTTTKTKMDTKTDSEAKVVNEEGQESVGDEKFKEDAEAKEGDAVNDLPNVEA